MNAAEAQMSDDKGSGMFSGGSLQTVVGVCFVLALLGVATSFYNALQVRKLGALTAGVANHNLGALANAISSAEERVAAMEAQHKEIASRLAEAEKQAAATVAADDLVEAE